MNTQKISPCMGCESREIGCHGKCERYAAFKQKNEAQKKTAREQLDALTYERVHKHKRLEKHMRKGE